MNDNSFDLIILGGGSATFSSAIRADEYGQRTLIINSGLPIGGTCVNVGCVPSKFLIRAGESIHRASFSPFDGVSLKTPAWDYGKIIQQKNALVAEMRKKKYSDIIERLDHVQIVEGFGRLLDANTVQVDGTSYHAAHIIIATGSTANIPAIAGLDTVPYFTNDSLFELEELPETLTILGGGYIGLEIAQAYRRFGSNVRIIESLDRILATESSDISGELSKHLMGEGIEIHTGVSVAEIKKRGNIIQISGLAGKNEVSWETSHLLVATGRKPNTPKIGLKDIGIDLSHKGQILISDTMQTSVENIYAIGDCTDKPPFVYTAAYEGAIAVQNIVGRSQHADFSIVPWVVFTDPQVAGIGIDEREAERKQIPFETSVLPLTEVPRSIAALDTRGFIKLIRNPETDLLLGARIVAPEGSELLMELSLAMKHQITTTELAETMHPYLTLSEAIKLAAIGFRKDIHTLSCCAA